MSLYSSIVPLCFSIISFAIARPRPFPPLLELRESSTLTKGLNISCCREAGIPIPLSSMVIINEFFEDFPEIY